MIEAFQKHFDNRSGARGRHEHEDRRAGEQTGRIRETPLFWGCHRV
jgi:hypothetical protein